MDKKYTCRELQKTFNFIRRYCMFSPWSTQYELHGDDCTVLYITDIHHISEDAACKEAIELFKEYPNINEFAIYKYISLADPPEDLVFIKTLKRYNYGF